MLIHIKDNLMKLSILNKMFENHQVSNVSGYPGSGTGGTRTMPMWAFPRKDIIDDDEDVRNKELEVTNKDLETNVPDDVPGELKKTNLTQPIMKEPNDWLNPKVAKHRGPGA